MLYFALKKEEPFTELENGHCDFDSVNKTITISSSAGAADWVKYTYQAVEYDYMDWNNPPKGQFFELVKSYVVDKDGYRIYQRQGKELELVEEGKHE